MHFPLKTRPFPISRDPPEGGTLYSIHCPPASLRFPISRDPPEGGTKLEHGYNGQIVEYMFPISRDPPEGGTGD